MEQRAGIEQNHTAICEKISQRLEELRAEYDMNYCQFSRFLGLQHYHLTQIIRLRKTPKLYTLVQIATLAEVPLTWLMGITDGYVKIDGVGESPTQGGIQNGQERIE